MLCVPEEAIMSVEVVSILALVAMFTIAFNRPVKAADGTWAEVASFVNVLVSHKLAEQCAEKGFMRFMPRGRL